VLKQPIEGDRIPPLIFWALRGGDHKRQVSAFADLFQRTVNEHLRNVLAALAGAVQKDEQRKLLAGISVVFRYGHRDHAFHLGLDDFAKGVGLNGLRDLNGDERGQQHRGPNLADIGAVS
jgi:hypothetical protein